MDDVQPELSDSQLTLLWDLTHAPRWADHLDGRTVASLVRRGLAVHRRGWVHAVPEARAVVQGHLRRLASRTTGRHARSLAALAQLDSALALDAEISVAETPVAAVDVLIAIFRIARRQSSGRPEEGPS